MYGTTSLACLLSSGFEVSTMSTNAIAHGAPLSVPSLTAVPDVVTAVKWGIEVIIPGEGIGDCRNRSVHRRKSADEVRIINQISV
jgi:hypothetical protein